HVRCPQRTWILLDRTSHVACMLLVSFRLVPAISVSVSFCSRQNRDQPSFPTRRSSDLCGRQRRVNARTDDGGAICVTCYARTRTDRKSTRLNSSHVSISYAVFCL